MIVYPLIIVVTVLAQPHRLLDAVVRLCGLPQAAVAVALLTPIAYSYFVQAPATVYTLESALEFLHFQAELGDRLVPILVVVAVVVAVAVVALALQGRHCEFMFCPRRNHEQVPSFVLQSKQMVRAHESLAQYSIRLNWRHRSQTPFGFTRLEYWGGSSPNLTLFI